MVNLCNLLVKYSHFSKVNDEIFVYIDHILENAYEIYRKQQNAKRDIECIAKQLKETPKCVTNIVDSPKTPGKKRKIRSTDTPLSARKENTYIIEDFRNKSDSESSFALKLNLLDSEESFFSLTQSPTEKEVLSPKNSTRAERTPLEEFNHSPTSVSQAPVSASRTSSLRTSFTCSATSHKVPHKLTTASGKWTAKKTASKNEAVHTPIGIKSFHSLVDGSRLRQTKLKFPQPDMGSLAKPVESICNDNTVLSDFVLPTPPSVANKSKFLRSLRMRKQSSMIDTAGYEGTCRKNSSTNTTRVGNFEANQPEPSVDDYDIDPTFCPEVDCFNRLVGRSSVKIKQELQKKSPNSANGFTLLENDAPNILDGTNQEADTSSVVIVPCSQATIISVVDSQPTTHGLNKARDKRNETGTTELPSLAESINRDKRQILSVLKTTASTSTIFHGSEQGLCINCAKLYKFHTSRGISDYTARSKLPTNCRHCRMAQLHNTPSGFWEPDFVPTQK